MNRIVNDVFLNSHNPTVGVDYRVVTYDLGSGKYAHLKMWDTAGQEVFRGLVPMYLRNSQCVLLVFDVTSRPSFESIRYWFECVKNGVDQDLSQIAISVVGNKIDLPNREVSPEEGLNLANLLNAGYFEVSAATKEGIQEALMGTVDEAVEKYNNRPRVVEPVRLEGTAKKAGCC
jgi:small GTP-binding protein